MKGVGTDQTVERGLAYVREGDLDRWLCRPLGTIDILDLQDRPVGQLDGLVIDRRRNRRDSNATAGLITRAGDSCQELLSSVIANAREEASYTSRNKSGRQHLQH